MSRTTSPPKLLSNETISPKRTASPVALANRPKATPDAVASASPAKVDVSSFEPSAPWEYWIDVWQRSVLFWDVLRQRANIMMEHEEAGMPPVLTFQYETLLDARRFERPTNYALLRITTVGEEHAEDCVDKTKPPVIVIDPRAGHGPGMGGFKRESEIGIALHEGHAVYFVTFFPAPSPHQRLVDVLHTLRRFVDEVVARHPGKTPILYGNCQGGWVATLVAIHCQGPVGAVVLNGSPLSYWAGASGANPMRLTGGLLGGSWITNFLADLGNGQFDGAWLIQNFENLKPEAVWEKYANLFLSVDKEQDRFLEFERWWNGWYSFSREEIVEVVDHLFIGNELEQGTLDLGDGVTDRPSPTPQSAGDLRLLRRQHHTAASGARLAESCLQDHGRPQAGGAAYRLPNQPACRASRHFRLSIGRPLRASCHPGEPRRCRGTRAGTLRDEDLQSNWRSRLSQTAVQRRLRGAPGRGPGFRLSAGSIRAGT